MSPDMLPETEICESPEVLLALDTLPETEISESREVPQINVFGRHNTAEDKGLQQQSGPANQSCH